MANTTEAERYLHEHIPLSQHMQVRVVSCDESGVTLAAPLESDINHRHTMFGGSVSALAILAAWTWLHTQLKEAVPATRLVIQSNTMHYLHPVEGEQQAHCAPPAAEEWQRFIRMLNRKSVARITLTVQLLSWGQSVGEFEGAYVAIQTVPPG